jgi:hypothetical protein
MIIGNFFANCSNSTQSVFVQCLPHLGVPPVLCLIQCGEILIIFQNLADCILQTVPGFPGLLYSWQSLQ